MLKQPGIKYLKLLSRRIREKPVASLGLVSLGAETDGVTYFSSKTDDLFSFLVIAPSAK